jgi:hypothetical protein
MADRRWAKQRAIRRLTAATVVVLLGIATTSAAQNVEIVPFGGYRVGSSGAGGTASTPVVYDNNGGVSFGALVDIPYGPPQDGLKFEALFSREQSWIQVQQGSAFNPKTRVDVTIDHFMLGGVQELDTAPGRAFIGGLFGLSRFAAPGEAEVRLTIGLSTGGKFFATRHVGVRIDARGYMTIVSLGNGAVACSGGCAVAFTINPAFQADLTAGLIIAF